MISEREFSGGFSSFWRGSVPNLEGVVRALNAGWERVEPPLRTPTAAKRRDIVSETAFKLFGLECMATAPTDFLPAAFELAGTTLAGLSNRRRTGLNSLSNAETQEIRSIAQRLHAFVRPRLNQSELRVEPHFRGHGFIGECWGDVADLKRIVEVKYVDRSFRSIDFRQCLVYVSLRYLEEGDTFSTITLYNPFWGVSVEVGVTDLVFGASGRSVIEFVSDFSYSVTAGELSR